MRARIHRGANEIGGNCVELECDGDRIVLDLGLPLDADEAPLPAIGGLTTPNGGGPLALFVTHGHPDHYGLIPQLDRNVPLFIGEATDRILREARFFTGADELPRAAGFLRHGEANQFGSFRVTPILVDHSAFDAYALIVDAGGRRLFYTGDLRSHGRKHVFDALADAPPTGVDVMLSEGTQIGRVSAAAPQTEAQLEQVIAKRAKATPGLVLCAYSPQNVDRLVTVYRAARRADRELVLDLYAAAIVAATGLDSIPQPEWTGIRVYVPNSQRRRVIRESAFARIDAVRRARIYPEELAARAGELVLTFRSSMASEIEKADCLDGAHLIWSMWPGYLENERGAELRAFCASHNIELEIAHTSGHAAPADLARLAKAIAPGRVVPIHTAAPDRFNDYFERVERHDDGEWWEV